MAVALLGAGPFVVAVHQPARLGEAGRMDMWSVKMWVFFACVFVTHLTGYWIGYWIGYFEGRKRR